MLAKDSKAKGRDMSCLVRVGGVNNWRPDKTVLSCRFQRCEHNCRQDQTFLSRLQLCSHHRCEQDKTVLSRLQLCSDRQRGQDKTHGNWVETRQNCLVGGVNKSLQTAEITSDNTPCDTVARRSVR